MGKYSWVEVPGESPRVHLYTKVRDGLYDEGVYDLAALAPDMPVIDDLHGLDYISSKGDLNGNGVTDIMGRHVDDNSFVVLLDAFTANERFIPLTAPGNTPTGHWNDQGTLEDLDHDGLNDAFANNEIGGYSVISYGDSLNPLSQQSVVPYTSAATPNARAVCLGTLEGKACMLRITWWWERRGPDSTQKWAYTLDVLNEQDLRERRDTIRYETVQRYDVGDYGWAYRDCFIIFEDVWQLTHYNARRTCLRVQLTGIEEHEPDPTFMMTDTILVKYGSMWGQAAAFEDKFIRVDGSQPFIVWYGANRVTPDSSFDVNIPELMNVVDPLTLRSEHLGIMKGAYTRYNHGHSSAACTTPDIDGDGISEVLLYYYATSPENGKSERVVDLFLTGDRPIVSVLEPDVNSTDSTQFCAVAVRHGTGWTLTCTQLPGMPASPQALIGCFDNAPTARVYDAQGRLVAELPVAYGANVSLQDPGTLPGSPLWAIVGSCTVRLQ